MNYAKKTSKIKTGIINNIRKEKETGVKAFFFRMEFEVNVVSTLVFLACLVSSAVSSFTPPTTSPYDDAAKAVIVGLHNKFRKQITSATNMADVSVGTRQWIFEPYLFVCFLFTTFDIHVKS